MSLEKPFAALIAGMTGWAQSEPGVRALIIVGSLARQDHPADRWSDLDLVAYVLDPQHFLKDDRWLRAFGDVWAQAIDHTPRADPELLIFYAGGLKVDILLVDFARLEGEDLAAWIQHPDFLEVFSRGVRVLVDKTVSRGSLPALSPQSKAHLPTQVELTELVNRFFLGAVRAARLIHRNDLWRAHEALDGEMKSSLLRMLEWHALAAHGPDYDVWYDGRFLSEWADPEALERLPACFGAYEQSSMLAAFDNTLQLFDDLGMQTCGRLGLEYPLAVSREIRLWLDKNLSLTG
jgi:aminoglycoside 6-adenylyltransferase